MMRAKRISSDEQLKLIMECRQSGLSDYQWCQANEINPGTFYNWLSRLRKRGMTIPCSAAASEPTAAGLQEVVKVDLILSMNLCQVTLSPMTVRFMILQPWHRKILLLKSFWEIQPSGSFLGRTGN